MSPTISPTMPSSRKKIAILHPTDPAGDLIGGIESFITGLLKAAPEDFDYFVIGVTTDESARPVGQWTKVSMGNAEYQHFSLFSVDNGGTRKRMPLTLSYLSALRRSQLSLAEFDALEFHRIEIPLLMRSSVNTTVFMHQNMNVLYNKQCDIRWKYAPWLYFFLEKQVLSRCRFVFCVREDAANEYKQKYPKWKDRFHFLPTWLDSDHFSSEEPMETPSLNASTSTSNIGTNSEKKRQTIVCVGRLDHQKNPTLMLQSLQLLVKKHPDVELLWVGDGALRKSLQEDIDAAGLGKQFVLLGQKRAPEIADLLRNADLFALSSAYEGMPISVLEALACGTPVCSTQVGEVGRVVSDGVNGFLASEQLPESFANCLAKGLEASHWMKGEQCSASVQPYVPESVLLPLHEMYRSD